MRYVLKYKIESIYEGHPKRFKRQPEIKTIAEHFCYGNRLSQLIKVEKTKSNFSLNFCARDAHTKAIGRQQI